MSLSKNHLPTTLFDEGLFRSVARNFASSVVIITVAHEDSIHGMTATSAAIVSIHPPLVLVCIHQGCRTHKMVAASCHFSLNFLSDKHRLLSERFAGRQPEIIDRFEDIAFHTAVTGAPILDDCLAWVDCRVAASYPGSDHTIYLGEVIAGGTGHSGRPLLHFQARYHRIAELDDPE